MLLDLLLQYPCVFVDVGDRNQIAVAVDVISSGALHPPDPFAEVPSHLLQIAADLRIQIAVAIFSFVVNPKKIGASQIESVGENMECQLVIQKAYLRLVVEDIPIVHVDSKLFFPIFFVFFHFG
jgi:hypothetical protein